MDRTLADPLVGAVLEGRYRIRGRIARGGMATVYDAVDDRLARTVAVKVMHPGYASDPSFVSRFIQEARSAAALSHPNVVAVYDQGVHEGLAFLVMENIPGRTLRELLAARGRLPADEACGVLDAILDALRAAHEAGMVHRDVKPENVLIGNDGRIKVADFGLARAATTVGPTSTKGVVMGTVAYVSPEQITHGHADKRSDVYSAGIMLFEMLTGDLPYTGNSPVNIAFQHVHSDVPAPSSRAPGISPALDALTVRATRRDPTARPVDAGMFLAELRAARANPNGVARPASATARPAAGAGAGAGPGPGGTAVLQPPPTATLVGPPPAPPGYGSGPPAQDPGPHGFASTAAPGMLPRSAPPGPHGGTGHGGTGPSGSGPSGSGPSGSGPSGSGRGGARHGVSRTDSRRIRLGIIAGAVVLALVAVGTGWWFGVGRYTEAPTLVNLSQPAATARAKDAGITVTFQKRYDEKALANLVFTQTPGPHQRVRRGGTVVATLSLGKERIKVPAVAGRTRADAERAIKAAGLTPKSGTPVFDDKVAKGSVVRTEPGTNQLLARNGAVTLVLSKGVGVDLPNLVGVTKDDAIAKLQQLGVQYTLNEVDNDDPDKAGTVLRQSPSEGPISKDTKVSLDVAPGQATVQVPNLFGKKFSDAKDELEDLGLKVKRDGGGRGEDARVLTQFPLPGTEVAADTEVFVIVG